MPYLILDIKGGVELTLHGPFTDAKEFEAKAQAVRDEQDAETDSIFALELAPDGSVTEIAAPGRDPGEAARCSGCGAWVEADDSYFATPCGTRCDACMEEHAEECGICRNEFDLGEDEEA